MGQQPALRTAAAVGGVMGCYIFYGYIQVRSAMHGTHAAGIHLRFATAGARVVCDIAAGDPALHAALLLTASVSALRGPQPH